MVDFILSILMLVAAGMLLMGIFKALEQIAAHLRGNPEAIKAVIEHAFLPLFGSQTESERKPPTSTAMLVSKPPSQPAGSD